MICYDDWGGRPAPLLWSSMLAMPIWSEEEARASQENHCMVRRDTIRLDSLKYTKHRTVCIHNSLPSTVLATEPWLLYRVIIIMSINTYETITYCWSHVNWGHSIETWSLWLEINMTQLHTAGHMWTEVTLESSLYLWINMTQLHTADHMWTGVTLWRHQHYNYE